MSNRTDSLISLIRELEQEMLQNHLTKDISIFLCGGANAEQKKLRFSLGDRIDQSSSKFIYSTYYPETLFTEILAGHSPSDLLRLENFLAESVNAVVIPLQSPGTFSELGAFSNIETLQDKLIIIIDPKFRRDRSFINEGPIRYIKQRTKSKVLYQKLDIDQVDTIAHEVTRAAREIASVTPLQPTIENPLVGQLFYLSLIYILDPISSYLFREIISYLLGPNADDYQVDTIFYSATNNATVKLLRNEQLTFVPRGFQKYLEQKGFNKKQISSLREDLARFRLDALNIYYKKPGIQWGETTYRP